MEDSMSVILVGMRGAGKSTVGALMYKILAFDRFIDLDIELEKEQKCSISSIIEKDGWEGFRKMEAELLVRKVKEFPERTVFATGGGVIETKSSMEFLKNQKNVIQILCPIDEIIQYLNADAEKNQGMSTDAANRRPDYTQSINETYNSRKETYFEVSDFELFWRPSKDYGNLEDIVSNFLFRLKNSHYPDLFEPYFFPKLITVSSSFIQNKINEDFSLGFDGILIHIDEVSEDVSSESNVDAIIRLHERFASLRRSTPLPLVLVVEPTSNFEQQLLISAFLSTGGEYIAVTQSTALYLSTLDNYSTRKIDLGKVIFLGSGCTETKELEQEISHFERYFLFGCPITGSPSPTLHNTGFGLIKGPSEAETNMRVCLVTRENPKDELLPFCKRNVPESVLEQVSKARKRRYFLSQTKSPEVVRHIIAQSSFRGASVTIPLKEKVIPFMHSLSESASKIEAVNTIVYDPAAKTFTGDNTDWIGLRNLLLPVLGQNAAGKKGLIIGAGGTSFAAAYCLKTFFNMDVCVYNRTIDKAQKLADRFDLSVCSDIHSFQENVDVVIGTVPASAGFTLPPQIVSQKPVIIDVAYKPRDTKLIQQAAEEGCTRFVGVEMLIQQGLEQFQTWTKCSDENLKEFQASIETEVYKFYEA